MCVDALVAAAGPLHCVSLQLDNGCGEIPQECFLDIDLLLLLRSRSLVLGHISVMSGDDFPPVAGVSWAVLAADISHSAYNELIACPRRTKGSITHEGVLHAHDDSIITNLGL
jgi:hypothetical protein